MTFYVHLVNNTVAEFRADFLTREFIGTRDRIFFWSKPRWYSRRRCIGLVDWETVFTIRTTPNSEQIAKELGVKL